MINRNLEVTIQKQLTKFPAIALLGARQVGKTTIAKQVAKTVRKQSLYLDLEKTSDLFKLDDAEAFLRLHSDKCIIIDEVQIKPELFSLLRALIDEKNRPGRFLLLGSASPDLIKGVSQSLAGRIMVMELGGINITEIPDTITVNKHWFRGGFPNALLAKTDIDYAYWMDNFIATFINKDIQFLFNTTISKTVMQNFWLMLASQTSSVWNGESFARALGITNPTISRYLDLLEASFIIRRLPSYHINTKKRLVKASKVYVRDTGLIHRLNRIHHYENIFESLVAGNSWESYVVEQVAQQKHKDIDIYYYRTRDGAECDLVFVKGIKVLACAEIKLSDSPELTKGNFQSFTDLKSKQNCIITPTGTAIKKSNGITVYGLRYFIEKVLPGLQ